ncbi:MAG: hypothetical protein JXA74_13440 [Anaerolineae bacterium]|nr:hypothetical protein [Anaerolineae bacterium]
MIADVPEQATDRYHHFEAAIYARVYEVIKMADLDWLRERFDLMSRYIKVSKVYLETHRDMVVAPDDTLAQAKVFFAERGVRTSGGITITVDESNRFETYCYTNPEHRRKLREVIAFTASHFDEVILDDFFFTNCKCKACIAAKGDRSWTEFRLALMEEAARELILAPAREANPRVEVVIKYPNWYEHFQGLGFNLEAEPALFDRLYTGTETRDPVLSNQHLQPYHGYSVFRYFENLKPGGNGGGWVDTGGMGTADRYAEQLWLTLLAKAPEMTLFDFRQLQQPLQESHRGAWQSPGNSLDYDRMVQDVRRDRGYLDPSATIALLAGYALEQMDQVLGVPGQPLGVKSYRPHHATGEDHLQSYLGMLGIPMDIVPEFPADDQTILLTEEAKFDPEIVGQIEGQLRAGKAVVVTSGLLRALQDRGIRQLVELEYTDRKALVQDFVVGWGWNNIQHADSPILIPQIGYLTNDSWEEITCLAGASGCPLLHSGRYADGTLYVLTVPEVFSDLYTLPDAVLDGVRRVVGQDLYVGMQGPSRISLFVYDNDTFVVHSFRDEPVAIRLVLDERVTALRDVVTEQLYPGEALPGLRGRPSGKRAYDVRIRPHSYRVFQCR